MAISIRDNLNPIVQESQAMMVRNDVGQPGFTICVMTKSWSQPLLAACAWYM